MTLRLLARISLLGLLGAPLGACVIDHGYGGPGAPYAGVDYDAYYDGSYGPFYGGYWGPGGVFYYWDADHAHYHRDGGGHFRREGAAGFTAVKGRAPAAEGHEGRPGRSR